MYYRSNLHKYFCILMEPKKSTVRRDKLISLQSRARNIWNRYQYFSVEPNQKPKFFMTFPYPYTNGLLHLGHAFSMTKCDFNAWYKRLCGFNVLFPFGFHCTGMPISAAAKKLQDQLSYGNPPVFPQNYKGNWYKNLIQMNVPVGEIEKFIDPKHWIRYFPGKAQENIMNYGLHTDISRSFITTDQNPYYNSFIEWQFNKLKERGYIKFGKRASIYSPKDKQMCADHDRKEGEGINPDEYTLIKIKILELNQALKQKLSGRNVFLVAATLRPETMYGQTSCFLLPTGQYCAVQMKNNEVFICSERSARNMAYQGLTKDNQKVEIITKIKGEQIMGLPLEAPLSQHKIVYSLPMMTISMNKGTGVVTCVPSDSPDDWMATCDLKNKQAFREKYGITEAMVDLKPVQIINIPSLSNLSAVTVCETMKIKSQNDRFQLDKAKDECYKKGFHQGKMLIGNFKGQKVSEAKNLVKKQMIDNGSALQYYQPAGLVISRSEDQCVVSFCEQWYINYADQEWKKKVLNHVQKNFKCNSETLHNDLIYTINWLRQWGCSRSFGLGTKLPFDPQYLIESLSDSTIYMAFYTISHLLQGNLDGSKLGILGIRHEEITEDFWDYVFLGKQYKSNKVPIYKLNKLRQSFLYWYPLDLRCSAKDLIKNHLTMSLFNHAAIWPDEPDKWPRSYYCNGYINIEGKKMSKSEGNFITLEQVLSQYGADAARLACAQSGDSINDANFTVEIANASILQLSTLQMFFNRALEHVNLYRTKQTNCPEAEYYDMVFQNQIEFQMIKVRQSYENMIYRDVIKYGLHDFVGIKDSYLLNCEPNKPRKDLIQRYMYLQLISLYPICPHFCQTAYIDYLLCFSSQNHPALLGSCSFPKCNIEINYGAIRSHQYFIKFMIHLRQALKKVSKPKKGEVPKFNKAIIIYRDKFQDYQIQMLKILGGCIIDGQIRADWRNQVKIESKQQKTKALMFGAFIADEFKLMGKDALEASLPFQQRKILEIFLPIIKKEINLQIEIVEVAQAPERENKGWKQTINTVTPGNPTVVFE